MFVAPAGEEPYPRAVLDGKHAEPVDLLLVDPGQPVERREALAGIMGRRAKAIVQEVKQSGLVSEVFYTERENEPGVDYVLSGELRSALYQGKMLTYLLSFAGTYLWRIGVPAGNSSNEIDLTLELRRPGSPEVLWSHPFRGEYGKVIGLYYNFSAELEGYPKLLRQALEEALPSVQAKLAILTPASPGSTPPIRGRPWALTSNRPETFAPGRIIEIHALRQPSRRRRGIVLLSGLSCYGEADSLRSMPGTGLLRHG